MKQNNYTDSLDHSFLKIYNKKWTADIPTDPPIRMCPGSSIGNLPFCGESMMMFTIRIETQVYQVIVRASMPHFRDLHN